MKTVNNWIFVNSAVEIIEFDYDSLLSLYVMTPFSIKSGISTANQGDNCKWKKFSNFTIQLN